MGKKYFAHHKKLLFCPSSWK